ncbi:MAG TPA: endonuclease/exonuclease/phosphatase family protein [Pseudolabrys sp.]|nr:endonuclease/exonuclease/phosphatase family protein [Pseudolabrys sp.]
MRIGSDGVVRVMTWNIHGALGRNPRFDLGHVVELIRKWNPDIVALQEVDSRRAFADGVNPFEFLPGAIGVYGIGARSLTTEDGDYGQMLISRWPMGTHEVRDISFPEREPRRAIRAEVETPFGPLVVVATHLGLSMRERRGQAHGLIELAAGGGPAIVIGDFNDWFWAGSVRAVLSRSLSGRTRFRTFPARFPLLRLDRIYCRPRAALVASYVDRAARGISDHLPVIADLRLA